MSNYPDKQDSQNQYPHQPQQPSGAPMPPIPPTQYPQQPPQYPYPPLPQATQNQYPAQSTQYPYPPMPQDPYAPMSQTLPNPYAPQPTQYPYPPAPPAQKKRKALLAWIIGGIVGALVLCGLCTWSANSFIGSQATAITGTTSNQQATSTETSSSQSSDTTPNSQGSNSNSNGSNSSSNGSNGTAAKVGQTITAATINVECTLVSVNPLTPDEIDPPKAGHEFIYVHVKLTNKDSSEENYDEFDFRIMDGNGNITNMDLAPTSYTANNELRVGKLAPGGSVEGDIIFQAPVGDHKARLLWTPSYFGSSSSTQYMWNLGL